MLPRQDTQMAPMVRPFLLVLGSSILILTTLFIALILAPLADLRSALQQSSSPDTLATIQHQVTIDLPAIPHILAFTHDGARLLVAFTNGPLSVYDSHALFQAGATSPLHTYPSSMGKPIREVSPSTGEAEHVAVLREPGDGLTVEILDVHKMSSLGGWNAGGSPGTNPTTCMLFLLLLFTSLTPYPVISIMVTQRQTDRNWPRERRPRVFQPHRHVCSQEHTSASAVGRRTDCYLHYVAV